MASTTSKKTPYDDYRSTPEWRILDDALKNLSYHGQVRCGVHRDFVIGFLAKSIVRGKTSNLEHQKEYVAPDVEDDVSDDAD